MSTTTEAKTGIRLETLTVRASLLVIVGVAAGVHGLLALRLRSPWVVPDELIYAELAKSIAEGGPPAIRDVTSFSYGLGYPVLIAPAWLVMDNLQSAFDAARVINALVMALAAVPAFYLARRFVCGRHALVAAVLTVAVPSLLYSGTLLTEVALYPAFILALLAIAVAVERPTTTTQAGALAAIALAAAFKIVSVVLVVAYVVSVVLYHWLETRDLSVLRVRLHTYRPTWLALAALTVAGGAVSVALQESPFHALGAYSEVIQHVELAVVPWWAILHLADLDLYVAVVPFAATVLVVGRGLRASSERRLHLFAALVLPVTAVLVFTVAAFASTPRPGGDAYVENVSRIHERSIFFLAPLMFLGLMLWLRGLRVGARLTVASAVIAALLPALIPLNRFDANVRFQALALVPWVDHRDVVQWPFGVLVLTCALGALLLLSPRVRVREGIVIASILTVLVMVGVSAQSSIQWASEWTRGVALSAEPSWIDETVGRDAVVSVLWSEPSGFRFAELAPRHRLVWINEFFNRSVGRVYELGSPMPYGLPATKVRIDGRRVLVRLSGEPADLGGLVLAPCYVRIFAKTIAREPLTGVRLYRATPPIRVVIRPPAACGVTG